MKVPLHWAIKFPLIVAITLAVLLVSYHYLVRPTFIGALLNGRKYPRGKRAPAASRIRARRHRKGRDRGGSTHRALRPAPTAAEHRAATSARPSRSSRTS